MSAPEKPRPDPLMTRGGWQVAAPTAAAVTATSGSLFGVPGMVATAGAAAGAAGVAAWRERQSRVQRKTGKAAARPARRPMRGPLAARLPGLGARSPASGGRGGGGSGLPRLGLGRGGGKGSPPGGRAGGSTGGGSGSGSGRRGFAPLRGLGLGRGAGAGSPQRKPGSAGGPRSSTGGGRGGSGRPSLLRRALGGGRRPGGSGGTRGSGGRGSGAGGGSTGRGSTGRGSGSSGASRGGAIGRALRRLTGQSSSGKGSSSGGAKGAAGRGSTGSGSAPRKAGLIKRAMGRLRGPSKKKRAGKRWSRPRWVGRILGHRPKPAAPADPPSGSSITKGVIEKALAPTGTGRRPAVPGGTGSPSPLTSSPTGGAMAQNPFTPVIEACAQAARAYSPENALRVIEWYEGMGDLIDAIAKMLRDQGQKTSEEFFLYPAAAEFAVALGDQFLKYKGPCEEARAAFLSIHSKDIARIKEPQRNQEKWDISANRD